MKFARIQLALFVAALALLSVPASAQLTSGNVTGTVYDPGGAAVPGAVVVAHNTATGIETTTQTTSKGDYVFENLPVGTYTVSATAAGFSKAEVANVVVQLNATSTANITLPIGKTSTSVQVTDSVPAIDTSTAQMQTTFETKQLADLPSASGGQAGSGVLNLSLLAPGVTTSGGAGYGEGPSVGGQRPTNNNYTVEGISNNSEFTTGPIVSVPNDAVAEFSVLENQFSPDFGHSSGGQFNEVVKSGTNTFHGELYEYFENRNLDAADNLNAVEGNPLHPRYDNNRFGGNFGGPIKRNKLFFFGDYEYNPVGQVASTYYYAPTQAGYNTLASLPGIDQTNLTEFQKYLGVAAVASPISSLPRNSPVLVAPMAGSNEALKTGVFAPGASGALSIPVGEISSALPNFTNSEYGIASVDYNISDNDSLRGRFILNRVGAIDSGGFPSVFFGIAPTNSYLATISEYHTFSPSVVNEFRIGYNRYLQSTPSFGNQTFPGLDQFPNLDIYELNAGFGPDFNSPQATIQNLYELNDNVTWTKGNHNFKFGFDGWQTISPVTFVQRERGDYEWTYLSDYLYDNYPDGIAQRTLSNTKYYSNQTLLAFYGNDNWKLRPNLTVNLGLRYEFMTVPKSENTQDLNASADAPGLITFNSPTAQTKNFMPRVGIAYSPGTNGTTSIRAGFGISYDTLYNNMGTLSLPPQLSTTVDVTGNPGTGFLANGGILPNTAVAIPEGAAARALTAGFIPNQQRPEAINWNFSIQHVFAKKYVFESRYVGTRGLYLPVQVQLNRQAIVNSSNALPVYVTAPSLATLNSLPSTLAGLEGQYPAGYTPPGYLAAGFTSPITAFMPIGNSIYHGWSNSLSRQFSHGLQFNGSYTWSHNIDDSTDVFDSTVLAPRRAQDSQDLAVERASSLLDHRNRVVLEVVYDVPFFKDRGWLLKNVIGNWEVAPVYIFQSGQLATAQSAVDSNLNGDSASDRVMVNPAGNMAIGSSAAPLLNSAGQTVAFVATNPNAGYILAPEGTLPNAGRNTLQLPPIDDIDLTVMKRFTITERARIEISARAFNIFNHPQYVGGYLNDVYPYGYQQGTASGDLARTTLIPGDTDFQQWSQAFSSNPRQMQLALKFIF